jgi:ADP-ribose pyrophosphatase YjhB (NUDIX family)
MSIYRKNCANCGKYGHPIKSCMEPIVSCGLICFNIETITNKQIENYSYNKFININEFNYLNLANLNLIPNSYNLIKILMVRRKHSLNYIDFIRGKYLLNNLNHLAKMFSLMTRNENIRILSYNFVDLWNNLWQNTAKNKSFQKEFNLSKGKFDELKKNHFFSLLDWEKLSMYNEPEWGFPKGRPNPNEKNLSCAIREFNEETNITFEQIYLLERTSNIVEDYIGTNGLKYRHIYYLASIDTELNIDMEPDSNEIGMIKWFTIPDALEKLREYFNARSQLIHQIYFFLINLSCEINKLYESNQLNQSSQSNVKKLCF